MTQCMIDVIDVILISCNHTLYYAVTLVVNVKIVGSLLKHVRIVGSLLKTCSTIELAGSL